MMLASLLALQIYAATENTRPVILTGEVQSMGAQSIIVPPSNSAPVVVRFFVPEGQLVKKGDVVLRIDNMGGQTQSQIQQQIEQAKARADKDIGNLRVALIEAQSVAAQSKAAMERAKIDAKLPKQFVSALDFDRYQNELVRSQADLAQKQLAAAAAEVSLNNMIQDVAKEQQKLQIELTYSNALKSRSEVIAAVDGVVTHGFSEWRGRRIDEGESVMPGNQAGQVVAGNEREIIAYALEADRTYLKVEQAVEVLVDAMPGQYIDSKITNISESPETRNIWGNGRYFRVRIALGTADAQRLVPGMSVRVRPKSSATASLKPVSQSRSVAIDLEGEISARVRTSIAPPAIKDVWQYTLMMLVPEGSVVSKDQPVAVFDGQQVQNQLGEKTRKLDEVQKQIKQLELNHAELEKQSAIATAEAAAALEKARRKAQQPADLIKRVDYDKLVIEREYQTRALTLAQEKQQALTAARSAERAEKSVEQRLLSAELAELKIALDKLSVKANNDGIVIHGQSFNGDKFTTGSQVFQGLAVATVSDVKTLRVDATVSEADSNAVVIGQRATIRFGNAGASLDASVSALGSVYRRKGRSQPSIVRDVTLEFAPGTRFPAELKPGLAVRVRIEAGSPTNKVAVQP